MASFLGASVRYRAWQSPVNTAAQRLARAQAQRRDAPSLAKGRTEARVSELARPAEGWPGAPGHLALEGCAPWLAAALPHPVRPGQRWL